MRDDDILIMDDLNYTTTVGEAVGCCELEPCDCHGRLVMAVDVCHENGLAAVIVESDVYSRAAMDRFASAVRDFLELDVLKIQFVTGDGSDPFAAPRSPGGLN